VGVFGGDADELAFEVRVAFPELPIEPISHAKTVQIRR
jgi:hypothetical protein